MVEQWELAAPMANAAVLYGDREAEMLLALLLFSSNCLHASGTFTEVVLALIFSLAVKEIALFIANSQRSKMHPHILMFSGMGCCERNAAFGARSVLFYYFLNASLRSNLVRSPKQSKTHQCPETPANFTNRKAKARTSQSCGWGVLEVLMVTCVTTVVPVAQTVQSPSSAVTTLDVPEAVAAAAKGCVSSSRLKLQHTCMKNHEQKPGAGRYDGLQLSRAHGDLHKRWFEMVSV